MKKGLYVLGLFILVLGLSGCMKFNANMDIKKDKSMDFSMIYALDTQYFGNEEILTDEDKKGMEELGFKIEEYKEGTMQGFKLIKSVKNIDEISGEKDAEYSLSAITEEDKDAKMFKVEKGFFKNKYTANLKFDSSDSSLTESDDTSIYNDTAEDDTLTTDDSTTDDSVSNMPNMDEAMMQNMMTSMDLSVNVTLPYPALSNNATKTENDGKTLTWNLSSSQEESMDFEFELYNMTNIYITVIAGAIVLLLIIILIVKSLKKNKNKTTTPTTNETPVDNNIIQNTTTVPNTQTTTPAPEINTQPVENTINTAAAPEINTQPTNQPFQVPNPIPTPDQTPQTSSVTQPVTEQNNQINNQN